MEENAGRIRRIWGAINALPEESRELVELVVDGLGPKKISIELGEKESRIKTKLREIYGTIGVQDLLQLSVVGYWKRLVKTQVILPVDGPLEDPLSPRELEVANLIANGYSNKDIAQRLNISDETVRSHASRIFAKMGCANRVQAAYRIIRHRLSAARAVPSPASQ